MHGPDKIDNLLAREPTVAEDVFEMYAIFDTPLNHLLHQLYLAHDALLLAAGDLRILPVSRPVLACCLTAVQPESRILVPAAEGEVHQQLADAVGQAAEKPL